MVSVQALKTALISLLKFATWFPSVCPIPLFFFFSFRRVLQVQLPLSAISGLPTFKAMQTALEKSWEIFSVDTSNMQFQLSACLVASTRFYFSSISISHAKLVFFSDAVENGLFLQSRTSEKRVAAPLPVHQPPPLLPNAFPTKKVSFFFASSLKA